MVMKTWLQRAPFASRYERCKRSRNVRSRALQDSVCSRDIASVALTLSPLARAKAKRMNRDQGWLNFRIANQPDITQRGHAYQYQGRGDKFATRKEADRGAGASTAQRLWFGVGLLAQR